jgi:hypothetical protein
VLDDVRAAVEQPDPPQSVAVAPSEAAAPAPAPTTTHEAAATDTDIAAPARAEAAVTDQPDVAATAGDSADEDAPGDTSDAAAEPDRDDRDTREAREDRDSRRRARRQARNVEPGILRIGGSSWSWVSVANYRKRDSLGAKFSLPPGRYTVRFENPRTGKTQSKQVTIESGKVFNLTHEWEDEE